MTGISKRNIHFYIKEGLLKPQINRANGYYDFTNEDCQRLILIRELRKADLSVNLIRSILERPSTANYYLRIHSNQLKKELAHQEQVLKSIQDILEQLPINSDFQQLYDLCAAVKIPEPLTIQELSNSETYDNDLVNVFLWRGMIPEGKLTEYQQYLWDKVKRMTRDLNNKDYQKLRDYLHSLSNEEVNLIFSQHNEHLHYVASLTPTALAGTIEDFKIILHNIPNHQMLLTQWKHNYQTYYLPASSIYDSDINTLIAEIIPWFHNYLENIHYICEILFEWLHSDAGEPVLVQLEQCLGDCLDLERCHHCEIEALISLYQLFS